MVEKILNAVLNSEAEKSCIIIIIIIIT